jgi:hypothetical protein
MSNRIGDYEVDDDHGGRLNTEQHDAAISFLKDKGKRNPVSYGIGGIVVHHKSIYYMINTQSYKWCPRRKSHEKWRRAKSMEEIWEGMEHNSKWAKHYRDIRTGDRVAVKKKIRTWHLYGHENECDYNELRTHIMSSNDLMEVETKMSYEGTGSQYRDMIIVHTDKIEEDTHE